MATTPDLNGPQAKVARAIEHDAEFNIALDEWVARRPVGIRLEHDADGWTNMIYVEREPIPLRAAAIFADFANSLESALDLLIAQLVMASGNEISTGNYFPIISDPAKWNDARPDKLKGVKDEWADIILSTQPLIDKPNAYKHPLVVLHTANKTNKHKMLMPAVIRNMEWEPTFQLNRNARAGEYAVHELAPLGAGAKVRDHDVLARVRVVSATGDLEITGFAEDEFPGAVGIGWEDFPVAFQPGDAFPYLLGYVTGVIDKFE